MVKHTNLIYDCIFWGELQYKVTKKLWNIIGNNPLGRSLFCYSPMIH